MRQVKEIRCLEVYVISTRNKAQPDKTGDDLNITRPTIKTEESSNGI